jgi:hypothetical protein
MLSWLLIHPSYAEDDAQKNVNDAYFFAELATANIIFHELGHYVIRNYNVQKFTFEEDLADSFVVYNLLVRPSQFKSSEDYEISSKDRHRVLMAGADIYYYRNLLEIDNTEEVYNHSTDKKRFFNYVCLMKDGNLEFFNSYIEKRQLENFLNNKCKSRYSNLIQSWNHYIDQNEAWGRNDQDYFTVNFNDTTNKNHQVIINYLDRENGWIEWAMRNFMVKSKDKITVNFEDCDGVKNAFYIQETKTIKVCYELFLSLKDLRMNILKLKHSL